MKLLVCGGRDYARRYVDRQRMSPVDVENARLNDAEVRHFDRRMAEVDGYYRISVVIEGEAPGADVMARQWAERHGRRVLPFPAQWGAHGKAAGSIRNRTMLLVGEPDLVLAFRGGLGTSHMVRIARDAGVTVWEA